VYSARQRQIDTTIGTCTTSLGRLKTGMPELFLDEGFEFPPAQRSNVPIPSFTLDEVGVNQCAQQILDFAGTKVGVQQVQRCHITQVCVWTMAHNLGRLLMRPRPLSGVRFPAPIDANSAGKATLGLWARRCRIVAGDGCGSEENWE
jgi:hypothetical protein